MKAYSLRIAEAARSLDIGKPQTHITGGHGKGIPVAGPAEGYRPSGVEPGDRYLAQRVIAPRAGLNGYNRARGGGGMADGKAASVGAAGGINLLGVGGEIPEEAWVQWA